LTLRVKDETLKSVVRDLIALFPVVADATDVRRKNTGFTGDIRYEVLP